MAAMTFDTLTTFKMLVTAGMSEQQAEAVVDILREVGRQRPARKRADRIEARYQRLQRYLPLSMWLAIDAQLVIIAFLFLS